MQEIEFNFFFDKIKKTTEKKYEKKPENPLRKCKYIPLINLLSCLKH